MERLIKTVIQLLVLGTVVAVVIIAQDKKNPSIQSSNTKQLAGKTTDCPHLPYGIPKGTPATNDFICRETYALSSNDATKFADWVAYMVKPENFECKVEQKRNWKADPKISLEETLEPEDYQRANKELKTDRGHQAPLASFKCGNWQETNYLSNITPQKAALNQGAWKDLEKGVRSLARKHGEVFVITGPVYERPMPPLPSADESHKIPSGYYKIITFNGQTQAYFFDQNTPSGTDFRSGRTSINEIERKTGLDFP